MLLNVLDCQSHMTFFLAVYQSHKNLGLKRKKPCKCVIELNGSHMGCYMESDWVQSTSGFDVLHNG